MKTFGIVILALFLISPELILFLAPGLAAGPQERTQSVRPKPTDKEVVWSAYLAEQMGGTAEYRLPCRCRVDILTADAAWEVEWPTKVSQAIGQAGHYGRATGRRGGIILLLGRKPGDREVIQYLHALEGANAHGLLLRVVDVREGH